VSRLGRLISGGANALAVFASGYSRHGASSAKQWAKGWLTSSGSPDDDQVDNLPALRERSRDLYMGTPLATGALKTLRTNVVGQGLRVSPEVDAEPLGLSDDEADRWESSVAREFSRWADTQLCDAARTATFGELQGLALLSTLMSGDCFVFLPTVEGQPGALYDLRVQLIEGDRVCTPPIGQRAAVKGNLFAGVELGGRGEPLAYHVAKYHPGDSLGVSGWTVVGEAGELHRVQNTWQRVPAFGAETGRRNVLHLFEQERPEQRRGIPVLAPVMQALKQLGRYTDAELMAAVVSGFFTAFIQSESASVPTGLGIASTEQIDSSDANTVEMGPGAVVGLRPGESVTLGNPTRPNTAFDGFVQSVLRQIGSALELPHELIVKHFTSSYSASRAAMLEAWKMFRSRRAWLISRLCQPVYEEWLAEAVARGRVVAPGFFSDPAVRAAWSQAEWYGPAPGQLDPLKEANAAVVRVENGLSTRTREAAELSGADFKRLHKVRVREERLRREGGVVFDGQGSLVDDEPVGAQDIRDTGGQ